MSFDQDLHHLVLAAHVCFEPQCLVCCKHLSSSFGLHVVGLAHWALFGYVQVPLPPSALHAALLRKPVLHEVGQQRIMSFDQDLHHLVLAAHVYFEPQCLVCCKHLSSSFGLHVGDAVGVCVGLCDGLWVGVRVGSWEGLLVVGGSVVGSSVGLGVGFRVGWNVGSAVGMWVGAGVGWFVGVCVGAKDGLLVVGGSVVGMSVGVWVGAGDG